MENFRVDNQHFSSGKRSRTFVLWLIAAGVFFVIVFFVALYGWYHYYQLKKTILFIPKNISALVVIEKNIWPWSKTTIAEMPLQNFITSATKDTTVDIVSLLSNVQQLTIIIKQVDNRVEKGAILFFEQNANTEFIESENVIRLDEKKYFISSSEMLRNDVAQTIQDRNLSLASTVDPQLFIGKDFSVYISPEVLNKILPNTNVVQQGNQAVFIHGLKKFHTFVLEITGLHFNFQSIDKTAEFFPSRAAVFVSPISLVSIPFMKDEYKTFIEQHNSALEQLHNINFQQDLISIFNESGFLGLFSDSKGSYDYVIGFSNDSHARKENFKQAVSLHMSYVYPTSTEKILPDGDVITEYKAMPELWNWQATEDGTIEYIQSPNGKILAVATNEKNLIIGSSVFAVEHIMQNDFISLSDKLEQCGIQNQKQTVVIVNPAELPEYVQNLLPDMPLLAFLGQGTTMGCLLADF